MGRKEQIHISMYELHGAFSATDTLLVSRVQALLALQMPFYVFGILGVRLVSALKENSTLMVLGLVNAVVNVVFNYVFMKSMGVAGIALSTSFVYLFSCSMLYWRLWPALSEKARIQKAEGVSAG